MILFTIPQDWLWLFILAIVIAGIFVVGCAFGFPYGLYRAKYEKFIKEHNEGIKELLKINEKYNFFYIKNRKANIRYDNFETYKDVSTEEFLTYFLSSRIQEYKELTDIAFSNQKNFDAYKKEVEAKCFIDKYDTKELLKNKAKLKRYETRLFNEYVHKPKIHLNMIVEVIMKGTIRDTERKTQTYHEKEVRDILDKLELNPKSKEYDPVKDTLFKIERSKITDYMKERVYENNVKKCAICGEREGPFTVDYVVPLEKGGKTEMRNLQIVCMDCYHKSLKKKKGRA